MEAASTLVKPHKNTLKNWIDRIQPKEMNGGVEAKKLVGRDQLLLSIFLTAWPDATNDEIAAFLVNNGGNLYTKSTIQRRLKQLKYSRKVASIEAYQAFLPRNLRKKERFFRYLHRWVSLVLNFDD